jgi:hypothetical protein
MFSSCSDEGDDEEWDRSMDGVISCDDTLATLSRQTTAFPCLSSPASLEEFAPFFLSPQNDCSSCDHDDPCDVQSSSSSNSQHTLVECFRSFTTTFSTDDKLNAMKLRPEQKLKTESIMDQYHSVLSLVNASYSEDNNTEINERKKGVLEVH